MSWEQHKLGDVCNQLTGAINPQTRPNELFVEYSMPAYDSGMKPNIVYGFTMNSTRKIVNESCLLINKLNVRKKRIWYIKNPTKNAVCSAEFIPLYSDDIDLLFLNYVVSRDSFTNYLEDCSSGSSNSQKRVTPDIIIEAKVFLPVKDEQLKIGRYFQKIDNLITLHQRKYFNAMNIKKIALLKFFSTLSHEIYRQFTNSWEQRKLGELGSVSMNRRIFKEQTTATGDVPFYKIGTFGGVPDAFISRNLFEEYKSKYPYPKIGDILISASGSIGRTVEYTGKDEYFQDSNIVWLSHDDKLDNTFLKAFYAIVKWSGIEGSTIKRLYNDNILNTEIKLPSVNEQQMIGKFFYKLDNLITLHQHENLKGGLL
nr:restriction endonuclease subunit S [Megasphaera stantonii]